MSALRRRQGRRSAAVDHAEATDQRGCGDRGRGLPDDGVVRPERPDGREDPGRDASARAARPPLRSATTRTPRPASWRRVAPTSSPSSSARRPSRSPATPSWPRPCAASRRAARAGGFRVMVEPLAPDGPDRGYDALLRAQHADGLVVSGPRTRRRRAGGLVDATASRSCSRAPCPASTSPASTSTTWPGRRRRRGAPDGPRSSAHRLHHERPARLHRCPGAAATGYREALRRGRHRRSTSAGRARPPSMPPSGHRGDGGAARARGHSMRSSWPATSSPSGPSARSARPVAECRTTYRVVGFDDIPLAAYFDPPLTTVRLPAFELGQAAGRALLERIADRSIADRTLLPTELIVRASTAPPRASSTRRQAVALDCPATVRRPGRRTGKGDEHGGADIRWRRASGLMAAVAIVAAACSRGGGSASPAAVGRGRSASPATSGEPAPSGSAAGGFAARTSAARSASTRRGPAPSRTTFCAMVEPWQECTGAKINYTGQRDLAGALTAGIAGGNLPDVAGLPGPGPDAAVVRRRRAQAARLRRLRGLRGGDAARLRRPRQGPGRQARRRSSPRAP